MFKKALFFSDLHLTSSCDSKYHVLVNFLKKLKPNEISHVFLLGDIFDLWIADRKYFLDEYSELIFQLKKLQAKSIEIYYFEGNHDLYLKKFWQNEMGFRVFSGPLNIKLAETKFRLEHGDQMDPSDKGYLFLRWFLRTTVMKWVAHHIPESWIVKLGQWSSKKSRKYTSEVKVIESDESTYKMLTHVEKQLQVQPFDFFICGHTHVKHIERLENTTVVNLGSWYDTPKVFQFTSLKNYGFITGTDKFLGLDM